MRLLPISNKQKQILAFRYTDYDALIAEGAIRSGKTVWMIYSFIEDAMERYNGQRFGICGKTVDSAIKNIIMPYLAMKAPKEKYNIKWRRSEKALIISRSNVQNVFEVFGGKDESSFALIQGRTLAGVFFDEVVLQPRSFVEQALARCSVDGSKFWFNCNPDSPVHWFNVEWVQQPEKHNALKIHFGLEDNPSLSNKIIERYKSMYSGVFYRRYILGEWCLAEGLVYDFGEENITDDIPVNGEYYISIDYGTQNPFSAGLWCVVGNKATRIKEYYYSGRKETVQKTDEEYCDEVVKLAEGFNVRKVVVDPSAASFIAALRKRGFAILKANNDVLDGIRRTSVFLKGGNIKIHRSCVNSIAEFGLYSWDEKSTTDKVIKEHDHCVTGDTEVHTLFGKKKIKNLVNKIGLCWSYNEKKRKKCVRPFFNVRRTRENAEIYKITLENGKIIKCTANHRILTNKGWVETKYLDKSSSEIIDIIDKSGKVAKIEKIPNEDVYNMDVLGTHNFAVNGGLIIHNCMDDIRYFCNTIMKNKVKENKYKPLWG